MPQALAGLFGGGGAGAAAGGGGAGAVSAAAGAEASSVAASSGLLTSDALAAAAAESGLTEVGLAEMYANTGAMSTTSMSGADLAEMAANTGGLPAQNLPPGTRDLGTGTGGAPDASRFGASDSTVPEDDEFWAKFSKNVKHGFGKGGEFVKGIHDKVKPFDMAAAGQGFASPGKGGRRLGPPGRPGAPVGGVNTVFTTGGLNALARAVQEGRYA